MEHAIDLFLAGDQLVCVITLAGAAEEILGKFVVASGKRHALDEKLDDMVEMYKAAFGEPESKTRKNLLDLRNQARNEMKHYCKGQPFSTNINQEAYSILNRAVKNLEALSVDIDIQFQMKTKQILKAFVERQ